MSNVRLTANEKQNGKVTYNADIVQNIVELAIAEVEGAMPVEDRKSGVALRIEKEGVYATVSIIVKYGFNVPELAYRVQQSIKQNVENMTKYKVIKVNIHVQDILFDASAQATTTQNCEEQEKQEQ